MYHYSWITGSHLSYLSHLSRNQPSLGVDRTAVDYGRANQWPTGSASCDEAEQTVQGMSESAKSKAFDLKSFVPGLPLSLQAVDAQSS